MTTSEAISVRHNSADSVSTWGLFAGLDFTNSDARDDLKLIHAAGFAALSRLLPVALRDTGQSSVVARFLLNLYNGYRFPFDMTDFRRLDHNLFVDCMTVLQMDYMPEHEVHEYFERGAAIWEQMAADWGFKDFESESWR